MTGQWVAALLAVVVILLTALPLLREDAWWIRIFDFPRLQVTAITLACMAAYVALGGWRDALDHVFLGALALCVVLQVIRIAPYTRTFPTQVKTELDPDPARSFSLLVANVYCPNRNAEGLLGIIRAHDPDLVLTLETDGWWQSRLAALEEAYPYIVRQPLDNLYGMHLYSRLELITPEIRFLVEEGVPSIHTRVVLPSGSRVELHCLHPAPPSPTQNDSSAPRDAELLLVARSLENRSGPAVVSGDLNDVAWSATTRLFRRVSGLADPRIGRGMYNTYNARYPFMRWPLDHIFCSRDMTLVFLARCAGFGSDHFPIYAELCHNPPGGALDERERPDRKDREWAEDKIEEGGAEEQPPP